MGGVLTLGPNTDSGVFALVGKGELLGSRDALGTRDTLRALLRATEFSIWD